jgi:hypothetical protein
MACVERTKVIIHRGLPFLKQTARLVAAWVHIQNCLIITEYLTSILRSAQALIPAVVLHFPTFGPACFSRND